MDWSKEEVSLIVDDYFKMLQLELNKEKYNKTLHRRLIMPQLNNRSNGSVEFKHQNITAALIKMGLPFIKGYKPRFNYQKEMLEKEISNYIDKNKRVLEERFENFSDSIINTHKNFKIDFANILDEEPMNSEVNEDEPLYAPIKVNYLEREQSNRKLGEEGERLIIKYEEWRLRQAGKENLADRIEWISKDHGDGMGFDILSKNTNGSDKFIEVKTTKLSKATPIFLTKNELSFSILKEKKFFLYRVFNFDSIPKIFIRNGQYGNFCKIIPETYKGFF